MPLINSCPGNLGKAQVPLLVLLKKEERSLQAVVTQQGKLSP